MFKKEAIESLIMGIVKFGDLSKTLRADKEVVMAAVKDNGWALRFASDELRGDREVVVAAVKSIGLSLKLASDELKGDRKVVLAAVNKNGYALEFASDELRGNKDVVMAAVKKCGGAYFWGSERMQRDFDVIVLANKNLMYFRETVDDHLCDELIEFKKKYGVNKLEVALEMEAAEIESAKLLSYSVKGGLYVSIGKRL